MNKNRFVYWGNRLMRKPKLSRKPIAYLLIQGFAVWSLLSAPLIAQNANRSADQPDNSKKNAEEQPTAEDQGSSPQDREITRNIRRELMNNNSLSTNAKNIKVITSNGKVTLRGPVGTQEERQTIAAIAEQAAGKGNVTNQLESKER